MSLICWLPLNQDLHNQGISNLVKANVSAATVLENNGKIGKCYTNTGTTASVATPLILNTIAFSACAWVRINTSHTNWCRAFGMSGTNTYFGLGCEHSNGTLLGFHFYKTIDGTNTGIFDSYPTSKQVGTWVHYAMTYDGEKAYLYENGNLLNTSTIAAARQNTRCEMTNLYLFGGTSGNYSQCSLNDVRIYDHCLSAAEVKEIAQGLVLHYKLDGFQGGYGNPNIIVTHSNAGVDGTGTSGWSAAGTGWSNSFVSATGATGGHAIRCTYANTSQTSGGIHHPTGIDKTTLTTGDIYTLSARIRTSKACVVTFQNELMTTGHSINATTEWQTYTYTCAIDTSKTYQSNVMYVRAADAVQNMWIECDWIKLEKGTAATPWQPSGVIGTAIQDSSGYNHNGSILNDVLISSDTPRYSTSTNLVAGNSAINCGRGGMVTDSITVNIWLKSSSWNNPVSCTEGGGWNFESNGDGFRFPVYLAGVGYKATGVTTTTRAQLCNNQWHMITGVYDRLNQKIRVYIDANLEYEENTSSSALIGYHGSNVIWIGAEASSSATAIGSNGMAGLFSDFRIYCTPLLDTDIKQLYNVGMKIDKLGSAHSFEFIEQQSNMIFPIELSRSNLEFTNGLSRYTQSNCQVTLTDQGYHIYRPPNLTTANDGNTMWGGLKLVNQKTDTVTAYDSNRDNNWGLQKGHTYFAAFHAKGKSSNSTSWGWANNMGWSGGGVNASPTIITNIGIPSDFQGEKDCIFIFTINDDIAKNCTSAYSSYVANTTYLSYRHLTFGWGYSSTGTLGTDLYLTDLRLYDITNYMAKITKQGQAKFYDFVEQLNKAQIRKNSEFLSSNFIER